ncbi:SDR family oxidoreductase [Longimicrobium sp.]|uniref:SDR family NAD(P)-dependent oxidoreductase n=1 Tax=Longimicrobium sp. TaxID=2029185 RepID=UPI002F94105F
MADRPAARSRSAAGAFDYRGQWALVTGASMGIGEAFARALAARGMNLVLCARSADRLQALGDALRREHGIGTQVVAADLAVPGAAARAWEQASSAHPIHLLVNNAGFGLRGRFHELPRERQGEMVSLNCTALLELAHLALGEMRGRGVGGIINVASIVAFQPVPSMAAYAATKAFVLSLSESLAVENRDAGVRVTALCPGPTPSGFQAVAGTRVYEGQPGYLTPEQVVAGGLEAFDAGKSHVVPGAANRAATLFGRLLPLGVAARIALRVNQRVG